MPGLLSAERHARPAPNLTGYENNVDQVLHDPATQRALPDLTTLEKTLGFDVFLASPPSTITSNARAVREHLRGYAVQLERHERFADIWRHQYENQLVDLRHLIMTLDTRTRELAATPTFQSNLITDELHDGILGAPEFEDLYYFLACKTRTLYKDLQLRFTSRSISLDDILHRRGSSSYEHTPCTVRDMRNFLRAVWFHVLHPTTIVAIEKSINHRKYQTLISNPLLPSYQDDTDLDDGHLQHYILGLNLDASTIHPMFDHLDDVSTMTTSELLLKVSHLGPFSPHTQLKSPTNSKPRPTEAHDNRVEGSVIPGQAEVSLRNHGHKFEAAGCSRDGDENVRSHRRTKSDFPTKPCAARYGGREQGSSSSRPWTTNLDIHAKGQIDRWVSDIDEVDEPESVHSRHSFEFSHKSKMLPSTPSQYRMPFHGDTEFIHTKPPPPPPKSTLQSTQAQELEKRKRLESLDQEKQLQDALQQVQILQRENSQLQERLNHVSPAKGIFRRLSKRGSRSPKRLSFTTASLMP